MSQRAFRIAILSSTVLVTVALGIAFAAGPELGSAYLMTTGIAGQDCPALTRAVALPLLRIGPDDPHARPITKGWAGAIWACMFLAPFLVAGWSIRAATVDRSVVRWVVGYSVFIPCVWIIMQTILVGLVVPLACL